MLIVEVHGGLHSRRYMGIPENKIEIMFWGTWDSNPGPNVHKPTPQPLNQSASFVSGLDNNEYISKTIIMPEKKIKARDFQRSQ